MPIIDWLATPSDMYAMAIEVGEAWRSGMKDANDALDIADQAKAARSPRQRK